MANRGTFKYICESCEAENWLTARERGSRFMPRCVECGSTFLEPSRGSDAKQKISDAHTAAKDNISIMNKKMGKE